MFEMDYDAYSPDSSRALKSGASYRLLGHTGATICQYAIYVSALTPPPLLSPPQPPLLLPRAQGGHARGYFLDGIFLHGASNGQTVSESDGGCAAIVPRGAWGEGG